MKSNVFKIEKGAVMLDEIFRESEKVAKYNDLNHKQSLQLRLLCEELVNMLPSIVSDFSGEFWIDSEDKYYELCLSVLVLAHNNGAIILPKDQIISILSVAKNELFKSQIIKRILRVGLQISGLVLHKSSLC